MLLRHGLPRHKQSGPPSSLPASVVFFELENSLQVSTCVYFHILVYSRAHDRSKPRIYCLLRQHFILSSSVNTLIYSYL